MSELRQSYETVRETVGVFPDAESLQAALDDLLKNGFIWNDMAVLADEKTIEKKLGHLYRRVEEAEDDPQAPRTVFLSRETLGAMEGAAIGAPLYLAAVAATGMVVASGGTLLSALGAAAVSGTAGAALGALLAQFIAKKHAEYIQKQVEHGGLLLWVSVHSIAEEQKARKILEKYSARDIHVHEIPVF